MRAWILVLFLIFAASGCQEKTPASGGQDESRRRQCRTLVEQSMSQAVLMLVGLEAEQAEAGSAGDRMKACLGEHPDDPGRCLDLDVKEALELRKKREQLLAECLSWPENVFDCIRKGDRTSPACRKAIDALDGRTTRVVGVPAGPEPRWTFWFSEKPRLTRLLSDGTVIANSEKHLLAIREGQRLWQSDFSPENWVVVLEDGSLLTADQQGRLIDLDSAGGKPRWRVDLPEHLESDRVFHQKARAVAAAREGDRVIVATNDARFFRLDSWRCKETPRACLVPDGRLRNETLDYDAVLMIGDRGTRYLQESGEVRAFSKKMRRLYTLRVRDRIGDLGSMPGGRLVLTTGNQLVVLDDAGCRSKNPLSLPAPREPESGGCRDCVAPPAGCVLQTLQFPGAQWAKPQPVDPDGLVMTVDDEIRLVRSGRIDWQKRVGAGAGLALQDRMVYAVTFGEEGQVPMAIWALSLADGTIRWRSELKDAPRQISTLSDAFVLLRRDWLCVLADRYLVGLNIGISQQ